MVFSPEMCIRKDNAFSLSFTILADVEQGEITSPILFNAYLNDSSVLILEENGRTGNIF